VEVNQWIMDQIYYFNYLIAFYTSYLFGLIMLLTRAEEIVEHATLGWWGSRPLNTFDIIN